MLARATRTAKYGMMADVLTNVKPGKARDLLSAVPQLEGVRHADTRRGVPDIFVEAEAADAKGLKLLTSIGFSGQRAWSVLKLISPWGEADRTDTRTNPLKNAFAPYSHGRRASGHRLQPRLRDGAGAGITHPKGALRDSSQSLFDCSQ